MSVADTLINFDDAVFAELPEPALFLNPELDVHQGPEHPQILREHATLLGVYLPMHSPGQILLIQRNLHRFYWSLIGRLRHGFPYLTPIDLLGRLNSLSI